ncbi:addiction module antidote protein, HigA family [Bdellovibrio sp. ZAP7]|uniref:HigA family addiction module antitoxin n=1 Tax=Bdellovibrio sp. ZAP7 TaxID=2231053 RepID=UPI001157D172|nr:HigA family addiction module antitoxin [Bdellovibrio sp. ZAP7]QDK46685.1 addiction module antidote protein, HigA family [Bdellovibrio sp. ZAP7]
MIEMKRQPTTPGEILNEEFLKPLNLTQRAFAEHIGVEVKTINRIVNGRQGLTPEIALRFAAALEVSVEFWLDLQKAQDLWRLKNSKIKLPKPLKAS